MRVSLGLAAILVTASASAQDVSRATGGTPNLELEYATYEHMGEQYRMREEYEAIGLGAPTAGLVISSISMFVGPGLMIAGIFDGFLSDDPAPPSARGPAMIGVGTIMTFGGLAGVIASSVVLAKKRKRRKWLASQLEAK